MNIIHWFVAVGCAMLAAGCASPSAKSDGLGHDHSHHDHSEGDESHHHDSEIHLSESDAASFGIEVSEINPAPFSGSVKVAGQLLAASGTQAVATAPSAGIISFGAELTPGREVRRGMRLASISARGMAGGDAVESARIAYQAAKRELDRVTPLHADGIVSTSAYNAALQAYETAKAAYSAGGAAGAVVTAPIAGVLSQVSVTDGQYVEAGAEIAVVTDGARLTLRADLPVDMASVIPSVESACVRGAGQSEVVALSSLNGRKETSRSVAGDGVLPSGYVPVYFTFDNPGTLQPGGYVEVYLLTGSRDGVLSVPRSALTEQEGNYAVFVKVHDDAYEKRLVSLGDTDGSRVEITSGIDAGDRVVTKGATLVKLAASSGKVPEGHSHNH